MMDRFRRIKDEFGTGALIRISVLLIGLILMALFDFFAFSGIGAGLIAAIGLALGFFFRRKIVDGADYYPRAISIGLFVYGIVLFLGDRVGLGNSAKLAVITATTVIMFDLQFWSLSDPSVLNAKRTTQV
ncbi:MAG: hypothetical protein H7Z38_00930 [Rubrivivax sp.]|nr:hypothetical protein [Pyrinomonadaceae bacterium]